jgi:integrase
VPCNSLRIFHWSIDTKSRLRQRLIKIGNELGIKIKGRGFHGLRCSFADSMFESRLRLDVIKELMRHSSINVTMKFYKSYQQSKLLGELGKFPKNFQI